MPEEIGILTAVFNQIVDGVVLPAMAMDEHGNARPSISVAQGAEVQDIGVAICHGADNIGVEELLDRFRARPVEIHDGVPITPDVGQDLSEGALRFVGHAVYRELLQVPAAELPQDFGSHGQVSAEAEDGSQVSLRVVEQFSVLERGENAGVDDGREGLDLRG